MSTDLSLMHTTARETPRDWQRRASRQPLEMKVGSLTDSFKLAGAIAKSARDGVPVVLLCCGVAASYQAVRALATATRYLRASEGLPIALWNKWAVSLCEYETALIAAEYIASNLAREAGISWHSAAMEERQGATLAPVQARLSF